MNDALKIYVDRLKDGHKEIIEEKVSSKFIGEDTGYQFDDTVSIEGEVYVADTEIIFHLNVDTKVYLPCIICGKKVESLIHIEGAYNNQELASVKGAVFDMQEILREMILLEVPAFIECNDGSCPERAEMAQYLKKKNSDDEKKSEAQESNPFLNLSSEIFKHD